MIRSLILVLLLAIVVTPIEAAKADALRLLAYGDSLTHGYGLEAGNTLPEKLEIALQDEGWAIKVINGGQSGDTTAGGLARLDWALADDPQAVMVELGANDMLRGLPPQAAEANLDALIQKLKDKGLPVLLTGMRAAPNWGEDYVEQFDGLYQRLADKHDIALYPFFLEGVALVPELNQSDGLHPNAAGIAELVRRLTPVIDAFLRESGFKKDKAP